MRALVFVAATVLSFAVFAGPAAPPGWRFPDKDDLKGGWVEYRDFVPVPYHARGDLNGDGKIDDVWILLPIKGEGFGLFAFVSKKNGRDYRVIDVFSDSESPAQWYAVVAKPPGRYLTWCGKGAGECDKDEPKVCDPQAFRLRIPHLGPSRRALLLECEEAVV